MPTCLRHRYIPHLIQNAEYLHFDIQSQGHLPENKLHLWHYSIFYVKLKYLSLLLTCVYLGRFGHGYASRFISFVFYVLCRGEWHLFLSHFAY
jgi:hypothetical protein